MLRLYKLPFLCLLSIVFLSEAQVTVNVDNGVKILKGIYNCSAIGEFKIDANPTYYKSRDGVKLIPAVSTGNSLVAPCNGTSAVLKADPTIVPQTKTTITPFPGSSVSFSTFTPEYIPEPGTYSVDKTNPVAFITGSATVSPVGASSYAIALDIPEAQNGTRPNLSIAYNSQGGNGLLGWGWDLEGISSVYRTSKTEFHDGQGSVIQFNANDRYTLNGSRLIETSANNFKTEISDLTEIAASGSAGYYTSFDATDRNGNKVNYGGVDLSDNDSKMFPSRDGSNLGIALAWKINRAQDPNGNAITYDYISDYGQHRISSIKYGAGTYEILFKYTGKSDPQAYYSAGDYSVKSNLLLKGIVILCKGIQIREYTFDYAYNQSIGPNRDYSKLVKINLNEGTANINPTQVNWQGNTAGLVTENNLKVTPGLNAYPFPDVKSMSTGDLNGDGLTDIVVLHGNKFRVNVNGYTIYDPLYIKILLGKSDNTYELVYSKAFPFLDNSLGGTYKSRSIINAWIYDTNNDGIDELITSEERSNGASYASNTYYQKNILTKDGSSYTLTTQDIYNTSNTRSAGIKDNRMKTVLAGDFDGDAKADFLFLKVVAGNPSAPQCYYKTTFCEFDYLDPEYCLSSTLNADGSNFSTLRDFNNIMPMDLDGDGKTELLQQKIQIYERQNYIQGNEILSLSGITQTQLPAYSNYSVFTDNKMLYPLFGDFNGDGRQDMFGYYYHKSIPCSRHYNPRFYLNNGNGYQESTGLTSSCQNFLPLDVPSPDDCSTWQADNEAPKQAIFTGDFNGDGKTDMIHIKRNASYDDATAPSTGQYKYMAMIGYSDGAFFDFEQAYIQIDDFEKSNVAVTDFNRDGKSDLLIIDKNGTAIVWYINKAEPETDRLVSRITNGFGLETTFTYGKPVDSQSSFYTPPAASPAFPLMKITPNHVVTQMLQPNGIGGNITNTFQYEGGLLHRTGKGFLGFQKFTANTAVGTVQTKQVTTFAYHTPSFTPYPSSSENYYAESGAPVLRASSTLTPNFASLNSPAPIAYFSYISSITSLDKINGTTTQKTSDYDVVTPGSATYGNLKSETSRTFKTTDNTETATNTTSYTYFNKTVNGRSIPLLSAVATSNSIGAGAAYSRTSTYPQASYDGNGRPTKIVYDNGITDDISYNSYGSIVSKSSSYTDYFGTAVNSSVAYTYSADGRFVNIKTVNGELSTKYDYDPVFGYIQRETSPNGLSITYDAYDALGTPLQVTDALGNVSKFTSAWGTGGLNFYTMVSETPGAPKITTNYDILGRETNSVAEAVYRSGENTAVNIVTSKTYDAAGRLTTNILPRFSGESAVNYTQAMAYEPDGTQRIKTLTDRTNVHTYTYAALSTSYKDPANRNNFSQTQFAYGLTKTSTDLTGNTVYYTGYHGSGQPQTIKPFNNDLYKVDMTYDAYGRRSTYHDQNMQVGKNIIYSYHPTGEIAQQTDANDNIQKVKYDNYGRVTEKEYVGDPKLVFTYNNATHPAPLSIKTVEFNDTKKQTVAYEYDGQGRQIKTTRKIEPEGTSLTFSFATEVKYDDYGNVIEKKFPSGLVLTYGYDKGTLKYIMKGTDYVWKLYGNKADGSITADQRGTLPQASYSFSTPFNFPTHANLYNGPDSHVFDASYNDKTGNVNQRTNYCSLTENFTYNADRLETWSDQSVTYDANGNFTAKSDMGTPVAGTAKPYQTVNVSVPAGSALGTDEQTFTYTKFNKIKTITQGTLTAFFTYGPEEQRIAMKMGNSYIMIYDGDYEAMVDLNGNIIKEWTYIAGPSGIVAVYYNNNGVKSINNVHTDPIGNIILIQNGAGTMQDSYSYSPWGLRRYCSGALTDNNALMRRGFTGHEHLPEFKLINMNGRLYDPALGRFIQPDPVIQFTFNSQSYNRYTYCLNNPLKYNDPTGYFLGTIFAYTVDFIETAFTKGGLDVTSSKSMGGAWSSFDPTADWSKTNHAFKIDMSWYQADPNRAWYENAGKIISRFTWELPQNLLGNVYSHGRNITGNVDRVDYFGGATFVTGENQDGSEGISLGNYINIDIRDNIEGSFEQRVLEDPLFMHEYGHTFDSQIFGPNYLFAVGIPSIFSAAGSKQVDGEPLGVQTHDFYWTETRANSHAKSYFSKHYGVDWNRATRYTRGRPIETFYPTHKR